ncbi:uncharacterized protein [Rutidosis leptorrhynchoides]|uniref:uncharacterized protein n=1 Tax=Rutidosis leptorrhynchoides TaxID=125765 RepID=UPI003A99AFA7
MSSPIHRLSSLLSPGTPSGYTTDSAGDSKKKSQEDLLAILAQAALEKYAQAFTVPDKGDEVLDNFYAGIMGGKVKPFMEVAPVNEKFAPHIANYVPESTPIIPLTMGWYDGTTDPDDFLQRYEGTARDQAWNDETKYLEFQTLLQGVAREWFSNLPLPLMTSYNDLRACFLLNFHNMRARKRTHVEFHNIRQGIKESLGQFIDRYTKEVAKMAGLPESQKVSGFIHGLYRERHLALWHRLRMKVPDTLAEAIKEAHEHMREMEDTIWDSGKNPDGRGNKDDDSYRGQTGGSKCKGDNYCQGSAPSKYNMFQKSSNSDQGKGHFPSQNFAT